MSISRRAWQTIVAHYRDGIAQVAAALDGALPKEAAQRARRARGRARRKAGVPDELARRLANLPVLEGRARHRAGRRPRQAEDRRGGRDLFRGRGLLPARPHRQRRAAASWCRIISTGWRSTARSIRSATPSGGSPPRWRQRRAPAPSAVEAWVTPRKAEVERIRCRDPRDRQFRADAVEAVGGGEPAGGSGEGVA